jgi:predicted ribosome quality control (RQC) complex YloA/Tae2 family protein
LYEAPGLISACSERGPATARLCAGLEVSYGSAWFQGRLVTGDPWWATRASVDARAGELAVVEKLTRVGGHRLTGLMTTVGAGKD